LRLSDGAGACDYVNGVRGSLDNQSITKELQILDVLNVVIDTNDLDLELFPLSGGFQVML